MAKKIKVLSVVDGTGWCGTKEQTYLITKHLAKYFDMHIAIAYGYDLMVSKFAEENLNIKIHLFQKPSLFKYSLNNILSLRKIINANQFDVIIPHSSNALNFVLLATIFMRNKPKILALKRSDFKPSYLSRLIKYSKADKIVVTSTFLENHFKNLWGDKLLAINSGVELSRFKPKQTFRDKYREDLGISKDEKVFINVANWQPWRKGQDILLKAFKNLNCKNCRLLLVGHDTDSQEAKNLIKSLNLEGKVLGLGFRTDVDKLLQASDFFVFTSYNETLAAAVVQAMASGKVVLSTLAGGIGEYLKDGVNGFSCPVGDVDCLTYKMKKMLDLTDEEYKKLSTEAIKTAQRYSIEETALKWKKLIEDVVQSK